VFDSIKEIMAKRSNAHVVILTLGNFEVWVGGQKVNPKAWKRDKSVQLLQFMLMARNRKAMHKEQIMDRLWEDEIDDQSFKVALHGINKVLEPTKKSHSEPSHIERIGLTYKLVLDDVWIDAIAFEALISLAHKIIRTESDMAIEALRTAMALHQGPFLPDRIYEDWSADERERLQLIYLNASMSLAELLLKTNPAESIQICQEALLVDVAWEDAYRIQMEAFHAKGNRPMSIKTYQVCEKVLWEEMALKPMPETRKLYEKIMGEV
jgi:DNA-binding SARP family transcriptional activator